MTKRRDRSLKKLQKIMPLLHGPQYCLDINNTFVGITSYAAKRIFGASAADIVGKTLNDLYRPEIANIITQHNNSSVRAKDTLCFEELITEISTGKEKYLNSIKSPLLSKEGKVVGILVTSIDITMQKEDAYKAKQLKVLGHLDRVAGLIPTPIYWLGLHQEYLGINNLVVEASGTRSYEEDFAGKTPFDLYPQEMAEEIVRHHIEVIETGKTLSAEETIRDLTTNTVKYFSAFIAPLRDDDENIIGTIGTSIDVTAEKEAARLAIESNAQRRRLEEQEKFKILAGQVVHDIRSPLASLLMVVKSCKSDIPELVRIALRNAANSIDDIANNLLNRYRREDGNSENKEITQDKDPIIVSLALSQIITEKRYQYKNRLVKINFDLRKNNGFCFIKMELISFKRMISNIVNNAVDSLDGREGTVTIDLSAEKGAVKVSIKDNGMGMAEDTIAKITTGIKVTANKKCGHGLGMIQVHEALKKYAGDMKISSKIGVGTEILLVFPRVTPPEWFAEQIRLRQNDMVVILDDDSSIHIAWETRFKRFSKNVDLEHFSLGIDAINFINSFEEKDRVILLADFELLRQDLNGFNVIEETAVKRAILVTSHYTSMHVRDLAIKHGVKILPKEFASEVPIIIENDPKKTDLVVIDDDEMFADSVALLFDDKNVDVYYDPDDFLTQKSIYGKDTIICIDNNLAHELNGTTLAGNLHDEGYKRVYILSCKDFEEGEAPDYLTVISKLDIDAIKNLFGQK